MPSPQLHPAPSPATLSKGFDYKALMVFGLALGTYVLTMPRTITLEDAGLFQMVCHLDGLAHPPGYPLFTLFCKPFVAIAGLAIPNPVITGNLISALFAAGAATLFYSCCRMISNDSRLALVAGLAWAFSPVFWSQALIIEVYSLAALLTMSCLFAVLKLRSTALIKWWYAGCLLFGLSLSNHWPLTLLSAPALICIGWPIRNIVVGWLKSSRIWLLSGLLFLAGLLPYVSLLFAVDPAISVSGGIHGAADFMAYVTRAHYSQEFNAGIPANLAFIWWLAELTINQATLTGLPFLLIGLVTQYRRFGGATASGMILLWLGTTVALVPLVGFQFNDSGKAFFLPYTLIAMAAPAFWFATGVSVFLETLVTRLPSLKDSANKDVAGNLIATALLMMIPIQHLAALDRSESRLADSFARTVLNSLPAGAVLFVSGDNQLGPFGYLHHVEGLRSDIELRSWRNTVFSNRLGSAFLPESERDQLIGTFIANTTRPVYSIPRLFTPFEDHGGYIKVAAGPEIAYVPELAQWLGYALTLYEQNLIKEPHMRRFLFQRLADFSTMLIQHGDRGTRPPPSEWVDLRARLLQTFPGKLALLEALFAEPHEDQQIPLMQELVTQAEQQIPTAADQGALGRFFFLAGQVNLLSSGDPASTSQYFQRSIEVYPQSDNESICALISLQQQEGEAAQETLNLCDAES